MFIDSRITVRMSEVTRENLKDIMTVRKRLEFCIQSKKKMDSEVKKVEYGQNTKYFRINSKGNLKHITLKTKKPC